MRGQWREFILAKCGIDTEQKKKGVGHECPVCGGKDRAHFKEQDGRVFLFCRGACGNANSTWGSNTCTTPEELCQRINGWSFPDFVDEVCDWLRVDNQKTERGSDAPNRTPNYKFDDRKTQSAPIEQESPELNLPEQHVDNLTNNPQNERTTARMPINQVIHQCIKKEWLKIALCKENALTGDDGEFLTLNGNLFVPLGVEMKGGRFVIVGGVEFGDTTVFHGSVSGAFCYFGRGVETVFTTDIIAALALSHQYSVIFAVDRRVSKKKKFDFAYINIDLDSDCARQIDIAIAHFGVGIKFIIPSHGDGSSYMRCFEVMNFKQLNAIANEIDDIETEKYTAKLQGEK